MSLTIQRTEINIATIPPVNAEGSDANKKYAGGRLRIADRPAQIPYDNVYPEKQNL